MSIGFSIHGVSSVSVEPKQSGGTRWVTLSIISRDTDVPTEVTFYFDSEERFESIKRTLGVPQEGPRE